VHSAPADAEKKVNGDLVLWPELIYSHITTAPIIGELKAVKAE
jgi:hypothetical protein